MIGRLRKHPFGVQAHFKSSLVLTFAVPKAELQALIPNVLELDLYKNEWAFLAIAMVQTQRLRPKGFPAMLGNNFFLIGYRIFVRYTNKRGRRLRGLYILKSETNRKKMEFLGNIFTKYAYSTTDISNITSGSRQCISSKKSGFNLVIDRSKSEIHLPQNSPFDSFHEARRFSGPLPFTFTYDNISKEMLIVEGVRSNWSPKPIQVEQFTFKFLDDLNLKGAVLANAFEVTDVPYSWKAGTIETLTP